MIIEVGALQARNLQILIISCEVCVLKKTGIARLGLLFIDFCGQ